MLRVMVWVAGGVVSAMEGLDWGSGCCGVRWSFGLLLTEVVRRCLQWGKWAVGRVGVIGGLGEEGGSMVSGLEEFGWILDAVEVWQSLGVAGRS